MSTSSLWSEIKQRSWIIYPLAVLIVILRAPDRCFMPQLWAEDGMVFLRGAIDDGWSSLFDDYAGYLHFLLRFVALLGVYLPLEWIPFYYYMGALLLMLLSMAVIRHSRIELPGKPWLALCLPLVALPGAVFFNLTNSQWFLSAAIPFILLQRPAASWKQSIYDVLIIFSLGLTGPFVLFWLPLLGLRLYWYKFNKLDLPALLAAVITTSIQLFYILKSDRGLGDGGIINHAEPVTLSKLLSILIFQPPGYYFFGNLHTYIPYVTGALGLLLVILWVKLILQLPNRLALFHITLILCGCLVLAMGLLSFVKHGFIMLRPGDLGERYFILLFIFASQSLVMLYFNLGKIAALAKPLMILMGLACLTTVTTFSQQPLKYLHWESRIRQARTDASLSRLKINPDETWDLSLGGNRDKNVNRWLAKDYKLKPAKPKSTPRKQETPGSEDAGL